VATAQSQQHPIAIYLWVWAALFVLSVGSYLVDYLQMEGMLKWGLITTFMLLKAGLIVAVFMHMIWERLAIVAAILVPPGVLIVLMLLMALEANYTFVTRLRYFLTG
jgi:cytochrome c oxidase subunit IV